MEEPPKRGGVSENGIEEIDSELRPIEMLSQKTDGNTNGDDGVGASGPMIKINVSHSTKQHQITLPAHSTFGVKDMSKVVLMEDAASKERKLEEMKRDQVISGALNSVALVRAEVDKLSQKASSLEAIMHGGTKVAEKEFVVLTELFMVQLLNLDSIDAEGEAKVQRRSEESRQGMTFQKHSELQFGKVSLHRRGSSRASTGQGDGDVESKLFHLQVVSQPDSVPGECLEG